MDLGTVSGLCPCLDLFFPGARREKVSCILSIKKESKKGCTAFIGV
jgi:hypothetical protein